MDYGMLEKDGIALVKRLPKSFVDDLARLLLAHDFSKILPDMMPALFPHIRTLLFEGMSGGIDEDELDKTIRAIVASVGIEIPKAPPSAA